MLALALPEVRGRGAVSGSGSPAARSAAGSRSRREGDGGFGYDPIFEPAGSRLAVGPSGEWTAEAKNRISHRGKAARRMHQVLIDLGF